MIETRTAQVLETAIERDTAPRLLYVTTVSGSLRGFLRPFARHFRNLGWTVDGMGRGVSDCTDCQRAFDRVWEAPWSRNPLNANNLVAAVREIRRVVDEGAYDIVHVHTPVAAFVTRFALRRRGPNRPIVIYTAHGFHFHPYGLPLKNAIFRTLEKAAGRWTDYLVTINRTDEAAAAAFRTVRPSQVRYIPGIGIDTSRFSPAAVPAGEGARIKAELGIPAETPMFLMLAEFNPGKRHADLLHAIAATGRQDFHVALAGDGRTREEMQALARELGVADRVHFLGMRRDAAALIRGSDAVMLPSEREGLSMSVMEALSLEKPVIGTRIRGIHDLVGDDAGVLVAPGDIAGLARAMCRILDDPAEARRMGETGRRNMKLFELRHVIEAHEDLYTAAMEERCLRN